MANDMFTRRDMLRKMGKAGILLGGALLIPNLLTACSSTTGSGTGPIKIGVLTDLSGFLAAYGEAMVDAIQIAVDEINEAGGVLGRKLELIVEDGASDPKVYVQKGQKLVEDHKVDFVIGAITSPERDAMEAPVADRGGTLFAYPELYEGGENNKNIMNTGPVPQQQVIPFIPWLIEKYGNKFYLVGADYEWPHKTSEVLKEAIKNNGGDVLGEEFMPFTATDFSAIIQRIKQSKPDVVYNNYNGPNYVNFLKQLQSMGIDAGNTGIASSFIGEIELPGLPPEVGNGIVVCKEYFASIDTPENKAFVKKYKEKYGQDAIPASEGVNSYNALKLYAAAAEKAQTLELDKVKEALLSVKVSSPTGELQFAPNENHLKLNMYIGEVNNGSYKIVKELGQIDPQQEKVW
jgi:urea transport system substrate-binding protein